MHGSQACKWPCIASHCISTVGASHWRSSPCVPTQAPAPLQRPPTMVAELVVQVPLARPPPHARQVPLEDRYWVPRHFVVRRVVGGAGVVIGAGVVCSAGERDQQAARRQCASPLTEAAGLTSASRAHRTGTGGEVGMGVVTMTGAGM
jgi:hypothetical protein